MTLAGANPAARIEALDRTPGEVNYFIGEDSSQWRRSIPRYERVRYSGVYPGIDLVYYGNGRKRRAANTTPSWRNFCNRFSLRAR